ncbi:MAG: nucleoside-diphosphate kinase, partial [Chloroflexi bacterium]
LQGRPFFPWLVDFMTALPVVVGRVSASAQALGVMRYDLGETQIAKSRPGSLRERYGIYGGLNCLHLSDAAATGKAEVERWSKHVQLDQVKVHLEESSRKPDHTFHLRSLATQVANDVHRGSASRMIRQLLAEETELDGEKLEALDRITLGALA